MIHTESAYTIMCDMISSLTRANSYLRALETRTGRPRESLRHSARGLSLRRPRDLLQASVLSPPQSTDSSGQLDGQPTQNYGYIGGSARDDDHANPGKRSSVIEHKGSTC